MLLLSAMLKNGEELAEWIGQITGRPCVSVDLLWKPSRQARGVLIYRDEELNEAKEAAAAVQACGKQKEGQEDEGLAGCGRQKASGTAVGNLGVAA
jgi:superfamily II RNA helicase